MKLHPSFRRLFSGLLLMVFLLPQVALFPLAASGDAVGITADRQERAVDVTKQIAEGDTKQSVKVGNERPAKVTGEPGAGNVQRTASGSTPGRAAREASVAASKRDLWVLAQAINGEARGEPYEGKVAVGAVILNRVRDQNFPDSVPGVVYQPGAFTAVSDGQINLQVEPESLRAAEDALKGWDPTGGALYYYNPVKTTNKWIWSRPVVLRIGDHLFAY